MTIEKRKNGSYTARVVVQGRRESIGTFDTYAEAFEAQRDHREISKPFSPLEFEETEVAPYQVKVPDFLQKLVNKFKRYD